MRAAPPPPDRAAMHFADQGLEDLPERNRMEPRVGMAAFYREYLIRRWAEGCQSVRLLMAEIEPLGYVGSYAGLARLLAPWRLHGLPACGPRPDGAPVASVFTRHVSPQIAAALLGQPRPLLTDRQADTVDALKAQCPGFTTMRRLVVEFPHHPARGQGGDPAPLAGAGARHQHPRAATLRADAPSRSRRRRRRRARTVEQRAGRRPHQSPQNAATADVRARRRRTPARSPLARPVGDPVGTTTVRSLRSAVDRTNTGFDRRGESCRHTLEHVDHRPAGSSRQRPAPKMRQNRNEVSPTAVILDSSAVMGQPRTSPRHTLAASLADHEWRRREQHMGHWPARMRQALVSARQG